MSLNFENIKTSEPEVKEKCYVRKEKSFWEKLTEKFESEYLDSEYLEKFSRQEIEIIFQLTKLNMPLGATKEELIKIIVKKIKKKDLKDYQDKGKSNPLFREILSEGRRIYIEDADISLGINDLRKLGDYELRAEALLQGVKTDPDLTNKEEFMGQIMEKLYEKASKNQEIKITKALKYILTTKKNSGGIKIKDTNGVFLTPQELSRLKRDDLLEIADDFKLLHNRGISAPEVKTHVYEYDDQSEIVRKLYNFFIMNPSRVRDGVSKKLSILIRQLDAEETVKEYYNNTDNQRIEKTKILDNLFGVYSPKITNMFGIDTNGLTKDYCIPDNNIVLDTGLNGAIQIDPYGNMVPIKNLMVTNRNGASVIDANGNMSPYYNQQQIMYGNTIAQTAGLNPYTYMMEGGYNILPNFYTVGGVLYNQGINI